MIEDPWREHFRDLRPFRVRREELEHPLVLLRHRHNLGWGCGNAHAHGCPVDISCRYRIANEILRTALRLLIETGIDHGNNLNNFFRRRRAGAIVVPILST